MKEKGLSAQSGKREHIHDSAGFENCEECKAKVRAQSNSVANNLIYGATFSLDSRILCGTMVPVKEMHMTIEQQKAAEYVRAIRNSKKHAYALQYLRYLNGASLTEPKSPERLSYMAAQAVRMQLHAILKTNAVCEGCIADGATPHSGWCELA